MEMNSTLQKIEALLKQRGWSMYRLAKESGIPYSSLSNMFKRNTEPTLSTLRALCNGLGVSLSDFFSDEPLPEKRDYQIEEEQLLIEYRALPRRDKQLLLTYLSALRRKLPEDGTEQPGR